MGFVGGGGILYQGKRRAYIMSYKYIIYGANVVVQLPSGYDYITRRGDHSIIRVV